MCKLLTGPVDPCPCIGAWLQVMADDLSDGQKVETLLGQSLTVASADGKVMFNDATVTAPDLEAGNGVVHVIDKVLLPPPLPSTVVDIVTGSPDHTVLTQAVVAADLAGALSGDGPFTVLAPTNAAFTEALTQLGISAEALLSDIATLTSVLQFHVIPGKVNHTHVHGTGALCKLLPPNGTPKLVLGRRSWQLTSAMARL